VPYDIAIMAPQKVKAAPPPEPTLAPAAHARAPGETCSGSSVDQPGAGGCPRLVHSQLALGLVLPP